MTDPRDPDEPRDPHDPTPKERPAPRTEPDTPQLAPGTKIGPDGRFRVEARIGKGGFGEVYKAWDSHLRNWVALKRLKSEAAGSEEQRRQLLREAQHARALQHPFIVTIYDVFEHEGELFIVQELAEGRRLRDVEKPLGEEAFLRFAEACAEALAYTAQKGIVHCDLKPENILLTDDGTPRILDFGLARRAISERAARSDSQDVTVSVDLSRVGGTPGYAAPEILDGMKPDARADAFSLGVVFYELLTGVSPFPGKTIEERVASTRHRVPPPLRDANPAVSKRLDELVLRMIEKDPERRLSSPAEVLERLRARRVGGGRWPIVGFAAIVIAVLVALEIGGGGGGGIGDRSVPSAPAAACLSVRPFRSLSEDPAVESFTLGITDRIKSMVARIEGVDVVDPEAGFETPLRLDGSVQHHNGTIRISFVIYDGGVTIGGDSFDASESDIFGLQDRVVASIFHILRERFQSLRPAPSDERPTLDPDAYRLYVEGKGYLRDYALADNIDRAIDAFEEALSEDPNFPLAMAALGEASWRRYELDLDDAWADRAEELALEALGLGPDVAEVHVTLGVVYLGTGRAEAAIGAFRRALELDPKNAEALQGLGRAQWTTGDLEAAERTLRGAVAAEPEYWLAYRELGAFYYRQSRFEETYHAWKQAVRVAPAYAYGYSNLGAVAQLLGRTEEAIEAYERSVELRPNYAALANLGTLYVQQGRYRDAISNYRRALELNDRNYVIWGNLGSALYHVEGEEAIADSVTRKAIDLAEAQLEVNANDPLVNAMVAQYYARLKEPITARAHAERALGAGAARGDVLFALSAAYENLGDREGALDVVRRGLEAGYPADEWRTREEFSDLVADPRFQRLAEGSESDR